MALDLNTPQPAAEMKPRIVVIGVGGAGGNAVNNMIRCNLEGVEFIAANTDAQALAQSATERRIQLGATLTRGLGAGARPDRGREAAEESLEEVMAMIQGANMVFIAAGMGGGTGTGAAPVIAQATREAGILTVGVVTKPFQFEGAQRMRLAEKGIESLQQIVDTLIIIPNQNLFRIATEKTTFAEAFKMADDVLHSGVRSVTDLMLMPGLINLDFADVHTVMSEMGKAMMGTGEAEGAERAVKAAEAAISNPLLEDVSMKGARGILINITGGSDMTLYEVDEAAGRIRKEVDPEANIIFGSTFDENLSGKIRISVVATGIDADQNALGAPEHGGQKAAPQADGHTAFRPGVAAARRHDDLGARDEDVFIPDAPWTNDGHPTALDIPEGENVFPLPSRRGAAAQRMEEQGTGRQGPWKEIFREMTGISERSQPTERAPKAAPSSGGAKPAPSTPEERVLDIPAFLRRQAN